MAMSCRWSARSVRSPCCCDVLYLGKTLGPTVLLLVVSLGLVHWRHGMHLQTGFDDYVMNPQTRVNLQARSPAIETMQSGTTQPFRAVGFGANLFPGYNAALGIEGINGPDALVNPYYRALTDALGIERKSGIGA